MDTFNQPNKRKRFILLSIIGTVLVAAIATTIWALKQQQDTRSSAGNETLIKLENFETATITKTKVGTFYLPTGSTISDLTQKVKIIPDTTNKVNPTKILTFNAKGLYASLETKIAEPNTYSTQGNFEIMFWDDPTRSYKVLFSVLQKDSATNYASLGVDSSVTTSNYIFRNKGVSFDTGMKRTKGWHTFKFHTTTFGTVAFIDNQPLSWIRAKLTNGTVSNTNTPTIYDLTTVNYATIETWGNNDTYWDNYKTSKFSTISSNVLLSERDLFTQLYDIYGNNYIQKDGEGNSKTLTWDRPTVTGAGTGAWYTADSGNVNFSQATIAAIAAERYVYMYKKGQTRNPQGNAAANVAIIKSQSILTEVINDYPKWGKRWDSPISMYTILLTASMQKSVGKLNTTTASNLKSIALQEANYWMKTDLHSIPGLGILDINGTVIQCNIRTTLPLSNPTDINDSKYNTCLANNSMAEENAWISAFFTFLADVYPNETDSSKWRIIGEQTAFAAFSNDQALSNGEGYVTTLSRDNILSNHGIINHPSYLMTVPQELSQGLLWKRTNAKDSQITGSYTNNMRTEWDILSRSIDWKTYNYKSIYTRDQIEQQKNKPWGRKDWVASVIYDTGRDDWGLDATAQNGAFAFLRNTVGLSDINLTSVIQKEWYWKDSKLSYPITEFKANEQIGAIDQMNTWNSNSFYFLNCMIAFDHLISYMYNNPTAIVLPTL